MVGELGVQVLQPTDDAVMREETAPLLERVRVVERDGTSRGEAQMSNKRPRDYVPRLTRELGVFVGRKGATMDDRPASVEDPEPCAVRFPAALDGKAVRGVEEPEGCPNAMAASRHRE
jgi:hypothetical protein